MEAFIVIVLYVCIVIFDFKRIIESKSKKEIWLYSLALVISFILLFLQSIDIHVPFDIY